MSERRGKFHGVIWPLKRWGTPDNWFVGVGGTDCNSVEIYTPCAIDDGKVDVVVMTRRDARLLAKRINQMLDETK